MKKFVVYTILLTVCVEAAFGVTGTTNSGVIGPLGSSINPHFIDFSVNGPQYGQSPSIPAGTDVNVGVVINADIDVVRDNRNTLAKVAVLPTSTSFSSVTLATCKSIPLSSYTTTGRLDSNQAMCIYDGQTYVKVMNDLSSGSNKLQYSYLWCGDSIVKSGEQCDDGNTAAGDGCSSTCTIESASCTDGIKNQNELGIDCGGVCSACVSPGMCTFSPTQNVQCPLTQFQNILGLGSLTLPPLIELTPLISKASQPFDRYYMFNEGYVRKADNSWQKFTYQFSGAQPVTFFDNAEANAAWFEITGSGQIIEPTAVHVMNTLLSGISGEHYITGFICGCMSSTDCRSQSNWVCNSNTAGISQGKWTAANS